MKAIELIGLIALFLLSQPARTSAHGDPIQLAFYGNYPGNAPLCQRTISKAGADCSARVVKIRDNCAKSELRGETCDFDADTLTGRARSRARSLVGRRCSAQDTRILIFGEISDARTDVSNICRDLERDVIDTLYSPVAAPLVDEEYRCVEILSAEFRRLLRYSIDHYRRVFDDIVAENFRVSEKMAMVAATLEDVDDRRMKLLSKVKASCGAAIESIYGTTVDALLAEAKGLGECFAGALYVQDSVLCVQ